MKLTYHAWIGEHIGVGSEDIPMEAQTLQDVITRLKGQGGEKMNIFSRIDRIYIAVNNRLVPKNNLSGIEINPSDIISFFPAISGG